MYQNKTGLVSVTALINPYLKTEFFTGEASERGSAVHSAISAHLNSLYVIPLKREWKLYFDSFRKWADQAIDSVILNEIRLTHPKPLEYCGQPDAILKLRNDKENILADWKTTQAYQKWWRVQGAAYLKLAQANNYDVNKGVSVRLKKDGSGCLVNRWPENIDNDFNIFIGLYNAYKFFEE